MRIKLIAAGAAIALAATIGSASAADQFSTLDGTSAQALTPQEMGMVIGSAAGDITLTFTGLVGNPTPTAAKVPDDGPNAIKHSPVLLLNQASVTGCTGGICTFGIVTME